MLKKLGIVLAVSFVVSVVSGFLLYDYVGDTVTTQIEEK